MNLRPVWATREDVFQKHDLFLVFMLGHQICLEALTCLAFLLFCILLGVKYLQTRTLLISAYSFCSAYFILWKNLSEHCYSISDTNIYPFNFVSIY